MGSFFAAIGDTQSVPKSTVSRAVSDVTEYLYNSSGRYIHFPTNDEYPMYAQDFAAMHGFPCIVGSVDGTHVTIQAPATDEKLYINWHWNHSMNVMAVCDAFLRFTYVDSRFPGSAHDSFILRRSAVGVQGERRRFHGYWLLGDSGYPLKPYLLTPVLNPQTESEIAYNRAQTATRATIERAFGVLKMRFRCLDDSGGRLLVEPEKAAKIVIACTALHNIAIQNNITIMQDNDWDGHQRPRRRRARVGADIFAPGPAQLEQGDPTGAVVRRRLIETRYRR